MRQQTSTSYKIGDATNYLEFKTDGEINLYGTAKITKSIWVPSNGLKAPGEKPASFIAHGLDTAWSFSDENVEGNQQAITGKLQVPRCIDRTIVPTIIVGWSTAGASAGNCEWQLEYLWIAPSESTIAAAQETLTVISAAPAVANGATMASFSGIDLPSAADNGVQFRLTRLSAGANDTIAADVVVLGVFFNYTANKLGTAT